MERVELRNTSHLRGERLTRRAICRLTEILHILGRPNEATALLQRAQAQAPNGLISYENDMIPQK